MKMDQKSAAAKKRSVNGMENAVNALHTIKQINVIRRRTVCVKAVEEAGAQIKG